MTSRSTFLALLLGALMTLSVGTAFGEGPSEVDAKAASIARQTMSPFCPGRTLDDCPSEYAAEWRRDIRAMVQKGMTAAEIQDELEKRAGGNLSGIPNRESSYALPIALATGAALVLYFVFVRLRRRDEEDEGGNSAERGSKGGRSKKKGAATAPPRAPTVDDERLKRELADED